MPGQYGGMAFVTLPYFALILLSYIHPTGLTNALRTAAPRISMALLPGGCAATWRAGLTVAPPFYRAIPAAAAWRRMVAVDEPNHLPRLTFCLASFLYRDLAYSTASRIFQTHTPFALARLPIAPPHSTFLLTLAPMALNVWPTYAVRVRHLLRHHRRQFLHSGSIPFVQRT